MKPWHELTSLPVQQVNKRAQGKTCLECYWWQPCPCRRCEYGVCGNKESMYHSGYTQADMMCTRWEE